MLSVVVIPLVREHLANAEELAELVQDVNTSFALRHGKLVSDLIAGPVAASATPVRLPDEADREATFSVYKTTYPATELDRPFLLVFRTRHVVTIVNITSDVTMSSAGYTGFSSI